MERKEAPHHDLTENDLIFGLVVQFICDLQ